MVVAQIHREPQDRRSVVDRKDEASHQRSLRRRIDAALQVGRQGVEPARVERDRATRRWIERRIEHGRVVEGPWNTAHRDERVVCGDHSGTWKVDGRGRTPRACGAAERVQVVVVEVDSGRGGDVAVEDVEHGVGRAVELRVDIDHRVVGTCHRDRIALEVPVDEVGERDRRDAQHRGRGHEPEWSHVEPLELFLIRSIPGEANSRNSEPSERRPLGADASRILTRRRLSSTPRPAIPTVISRYGQDSRRAVTRCRHRRRRRAMEHRPRSEGLGPCPQRRCPSVK